MSVPVRGAETAGATPRYRAVLLDFDGTIADSLGHLRAVYANFVRSLGGEPSDGEFEACNGLHLTEVVRRLCEKHGKSDSGQLEHYHDMVDRDFAAVPALAGAGELLDAAARLGMTSVIVTSNRRGRVEAWLEANRLNGRCSVIVSEEDGLPGKPSPAPYLAALEKLNLEASQAVAVEDSEAGARSASAAGLITIKLGEIPTGSWEAPLHPAADLKAAAAYLARWSGAAA
jgi:HAD superfamily hydrolase (TIGR01509 family)